MTVSRRDQDRNNQARVESDLVLFKYAAKHWQSPPKDYLFEGLFDDYRDELNAHREHTLKPDERFKLYRALELLNALDTLECGSHSS